VFGFVPGYTEEEARRVVAESLSYSEALRRLGMSPAGGNHALFRKWVDQIWKIPTDHFDPHASIRQAGRRRTPPLEEVLVENSAYSRSALKRRLFESGLKKPECELCAQGPIWRGREMALILDHINGIPTDNRIANLRIICPNCAATLDTHCGRKNRQRRRACLTCEQEFEVKYGTHRYCSLGCVQHRPFGHGVPRPERRKVVRPDYEQLTKEIEETSYVAVGRKYGVSDNAIRKWIRQYEREAERAELRAAA
jgi:transposase-like protein